MEIIEKLNAVLEQTKTGAQYDVKSIPVKLSQEDLSINGILDEYLNASSEKREKIIESITSDLAWMLLSFAIRMATYSLRLTDQRLFTNGLTALSMVGTLDKREILLVLPLYYDAKLKNNLSFAKILETKDEFAELLEKFINREEADKTLECMGYTLRADEKNTLSYQRTW